MSNATLNIGGDIVRGFEGGFSVSNATLNIGGDIVRGFEGVLVCQMLH